MRSPSSFPPDQAGAPRAFYIIDQTRVARYLAVWGVVVAIEESISDAEARGESAKISQRKERSFQLPFNFFTAERKRSETVEDSTSLETQVTRVLRRNTCIEDSAQVLQDLLAETTWAVDLTARIRQLAKTWLTIVHQFEQQCGRFAFKLPTELIDRSNLHVEQLVSQEVDRLLKTPPRVLILDLFDTALEEVGDNREILQLTGTARISLELLGSRSVIDCCRVTTTFLKKSLTEDGDLLRQTGKSLSGQLIGEPKGVPGVSSNGVERNLEVQPILLSEIRP